MSKQTAKGERLQLRLTAEEVAKLDTCARAAGLDRSKLIRRFIDLAHRDVTRPRWMSEWIRKPEGMPSE